MTNLLKKNERGFTLIEVVLVLAIAGLLLVVVFLAVSGAQKSRRDSQRKNDNARIESQLENYASNNNGKYPGNNAELATFTSSYLSGFTNPTGGTYNVSLSGTTLPGSNPSVGTDNVNYYVSGRTVELCMGLENGVQCLSNK